jgi:hypothetical protein
MAIHNRLLLDRVGIGVTLRSCHTRAYHLSCNPAVRNY